MTTFGAVHDDSSSVLPTDERQALLGNRPRVQQDDGGTDYPVRKEQLHRMYESIDGHASQGSIDGGVCPALTKRRRATSTWHCRLVMISVGVIFVSFLSCLWTRKDERTPSASPGALRVESTTEPSDAKHPHTMEQNDASPSSSILLVDDSVIEQWEEWKVPAENIRSGSVWKYSLPSLYHVWQEMTLDKQDESTHGRRLESDESLVADSQDAATENPTKAPHGAATNLPTLKVIAETKVPTSANTRAPATPAHTPETSPVHKSKAATSHTSQPVAHPAKPVATPSSGTYPTKRTSLHPTQLAESKAPSSESSKETSDQEESEVESWFKNKWNEASEGAEKTWQKVTDEEHTIVAKFEANHTVEDQTIQNSSNETWVDEGEDWYHNFVNRLQKLGKHMRSWWVNTENATEHESREIGDWLNRTENDLAQDERIVQGRFEQWWTKATAAERSWWKQTSKTFHDYAHTMEEKEKLWWAITRDTVKRDWAALVRGGENLVNQSLFWEENLANETSLISREAWNTSSNAAVQAWTWTVDEEQTIWHAVQHWYRAHATYQEEMQMPLLYFNTTEAFSLLMNGYGWFDYSQDFLHMQEGFDVQVNQAYCAVATSAAILNSFPRETVLLPIDSIYSPHPYATQRSLVASSCVQQTVVLHNDTFDGVRHTPGGISLEQTRSLLDCHLNTSEYDIEIVHVDPRNYTLDKVRQDLRLALMDPLARVLVNFDRRVLGQEGGGHFSPLGSYTEREDAFLIMDVAKYKYPPVWVPAARLFASMATVDKCGDWDFPQAQDRVSKDDYKQAVSSHTIFEELLQELNCEQRYRGYIIVRSL